MKTTRIEATTNRFPAEVPLVYAPLRGTVTLTERPGLGLEPNEQALKDTREP
ncbi:MAG: hypothetical protein ACREQA_21495 [Candidatus Binatia bacterium]